MLNEIPKSADAALLFSQCEKKEEENNVLELIGTRADGRIGDQRPVDGFSLLPLRPYSSRLSG